MRVSVCAREASHGWPKANHSAIGHIPEATAAAGFTFHHDARRHDITVGGKHVIQVLVGDIIGNVKDEQVGARGT